jgi:2-polyprenyl-6-methoxyphenol hydroxylase-like FAD-dependent oxidoreductase
MDAQVIVVGAGPVGLLLAAELRLAGAEPLVLERLTEPSTETKARGVGPLASEALWRRGLGPRLAEEHERGMLDLARDHGSRAGHFANIHKLTPDPDRPATAIWQPRLEQLLTEHAGALGVPIRRGAEVTALDQDDDGVTVTVGGQRLRADYLVGCDGGRSTVRKLAGFGFPGTPAVLRSIAGRVRFGSEIPPMGRYPGGSFAGRYVPGQGPSLSGLSEPAQGAEPEGPVTTGEFAEAIRRVTGSTVLVEELHDVRRFNDQARQADTYRIGRVLLAGDAAHVHSPSGGQGLNLGLMDAVNLGWKLAAVLRGRPGALLDTYTTERHPVGAAVLRNTRAQAALLTPGAHVDALREIVAELMDIPEVDRYFTDLLSALHQRYEFPYPATAPVGQHCADLELVDDAGTKSRLHQHTASGRGLLLLPAGARELADGRVDVVAHVKPLLLRPDGVIAWAGGDAASLRVALDTWFGPVC